MNAHLQAMRANCARILMGRRSCTGVSVLATVATPIQGEMAGSSPAAVPSEPVDAPIIDVADFVSDDARPTGLTTAEHRQVTAVVARLTREPVTSEESALIVALQPGKHARWVGGNPRSFLRSIQGVETLTAKQRDYLWDLAWEFRARLTPHMRAWSWARRRDVRWRR